MSPYLATAKTVREIKYRSAFSFVSVENHADIMVAERLEKGDEWIIKYQ